MMLDLLLWWHARMTELLPAFWLGRRRHAPDAVVIDAADKFEDVKARLRRNGEEAPIALDAIVRAAGRMPIVLRPQPRVILEKLHTVPATARRDLAQVLRHELGRITPFSADAVSWRWEARPVNRDRTLLEVQLTIVPRTAVATTLRGLAAIGIQPRFMEVGAAERLRLLAIAEADTARPWFLPDAGSLAWICAGLAVIAVTVPFALQAWAMHVTDRAIAALQPAVAQAEALRGGVSKNSTEAAVMARELERTGDPLQILATVTRILPDDTYLTDLSLRQRQLTIVGRSSSAPRLITGMSADPTIRNAAFAAPVTRVEGASVDMFSIRAEIAP